MIVLVVLFHLGEAFPANSGFMGLVILFFTNPPQEEEHFYGHTPGSMAFRIPGTNRQ